MANQKYIIRCDRAGVFFGEVKERNGREVTLANARRLWRWYGATECIQLAVEGVSKPRECMFTMRIPEMIVLDAIELLPCSDKAGASIEAVPEWKR